MKLYGKSRPLSIIENFIHSGKMPHGIIFTGESGIGKSLIAEYTAKLLLCEKKAEKPCGLCAVCRKAENNQHPDIIDVKALMEDGKYRVNSMRDVVSSSVKRPNDGDIKVYIFKNSETMPPACQNTLLKFIEEPAPFNRFIFTASSSGENAGAMLETVMSRLIRIEVESPASNECINILIDNGAEETEANEIVSVFGKNPEQALDILKSKSNNENTENDFLLGTVKKITDSIINKNEYIMASGFSRLKNRDMLSSLLDMLLGILRCALIYKCTGKSKNIPCLYYEGAYGIAKKFGLSELIKTQERIMEYLKQLEQNPNVTLSCVAYQSGIYKQLTMDK